MGFDDIDKKFRPEQAGTTFEGIDRRFRAKPVETERECPKCFDSGWECYGIGRGDPHFRLCDECYNPKGHPCP